MKKSIFLPYLQLTGAMIIVGSNIVVGKLISNGFPLFIASTFAQTIWRLHAVERGLLIPILCL